MFATFRPCGPVPQTAAERLDATAITAIGRKLDAVYRQTTRLYSWCTGATSQGQIDATSLSVFADLLGQVDYRFGTAEYHFEIDAATVIAQSANRGSKSRSSSTIARHVNRMRRIAAYNVPKFEDRVDNGTVELTPDEIARVAGYREAAILLLVDDLGAIVDGRSMLSHDQLTVSTTKTIAPILLAAAEATLDSLERGSAFVVARHRAHERLPLVQGFWTGCTR